jgi:hypothetical protein
MLEWESSASSISWSCTASCLNSHLLWIVRVRFSTPRSGVEWSWVHVSQEGDPRLTNDEIHSPFLGLYWYSYASDQNECFGWLQGQYSCDTVVQLQSYTITTPRTVLY